MRRQIIITTFADANIKNIIAMKRFTLLLLLVAGLTSGRASETWSQLLTVETDTAEYVTPKDTTVYFPPVDTTHYEPVDTGGVVRPDIPSKPVIYVPTIREEDNVTEYPHNPAADGSQQEFAMSIEGDYLRIKGTLMARGYDKHYIHCQIIGDSVHLQRFDMDPESTDMILHNVDIRIPGFTEDYYHVTLAEQNDVPLYKQYMVMAKAVTRSERQIIPFAEEGKTWVCSGVNLSLPPQYNHNYYNTTFYVQGDTLLDGEEYKKIYSHKVYSNGDEEKSIGYVKTNEANAWGFDFSLNVGDFKLCEDYDDTKTGWQVKTVKDTILNDGIKRRCLYLDYLIIKKNEDVTYVYGSDIWVEGIGSLISGIILEDPMRNGGGSYELQSVSIGNNYIYTKKQEDKPIIEPVFAGAEITPQSPTTNDEINFSVIVGAFAGNFSYTQKVDSIIGNNIYVGASYYGYDIGITMLPVAYDTPLGRLAEGNYTLIHTVRAMPSQTDFIFTYDFSVKDANQITFQTSTCIKVRTTAFTLLCTAPNAVKLEVYTMDAIKVGEARFVDGEATVKVGQVPAMYLYVVTYPDGRRESGKAMISEE